MGKPYYHDATAGITIYCGDARDVLPTLPAESVDLIVTSPPYNMGASPWPHLGNWKPGDAPGSKSKWRMMIECHGLNMSHGNAKF
jgi:DNA modification methylase